MKLRKPVQWFAERMEEKLREHDEQRGERGWRNEHDCDEYFLLDRLEEEVLEIRQAIVRGGLTWNPRVVGECADVANFAMMIADLANVGTE